MGAEQSLVQQIVATVKEAYLVDIRNRIIISINNTMTDVLNHLQDNYGQLILHELPYHKEIVNKMIYSFQDPIVTLLYALKELLEIANITITL